MKYYYVKSRLSGLYLDLEAGGQKPVCRVVPWNRSLADSQIWYDDMKTGTIRNKLNNYCIDIEGDVAIVKPFLEGDRNQQWERHGNTIRSRGNHKKVLDIFGNNMDQGAEIGPYDFSGNDNQTWDFEFIDEISWGGSATTDTSASRRFYIVSELDHLVVDISGGDRDKGTKIIMYTKNDDVQRNQLWYLDKQGYIRSDLNDMVFANEEPGDKLKMEPFSNNPRSQWVIDGKKIVNRTGEVLDIRGEKEKEGAELCSFQYKGTPNQHWKIQYA